MKKYLLVISNSFQDYFAYRLNFILWRVRVVLSIIISFFLWQTIFRTQNQVFGYSEARMLTYILLITFINGIVLSTQTFRVAEDINFGRLSNMLVRPINYFGFIFAQDLSDKLINTLFSLVELTLLIFLLRPPMILQTNSHFLLLFTTSTLFAAILYFEIGILLSCIGFWSRETWAPRFIFSILVTFLAGTYFPLDILPSAIYYLLQFSPFSYLVFFPLKMYLGEVSNQFVLTGFAVMFFWIVILWFVLNSLWRKGLKIYRSEGG